jgi:hypothetical protein
MLAHVYMHQKNGGKHTPFSMPHTPVNNEKSKQNVPRIQKENVNVSNLRSCAGSLSTVTPSSVDSRRKPFSVGNNKTHFMCHAQKNKIMD